MKELYRLKSASIPIKIAILSFVTNTILFLMYFFELIPVYVIYASFFFILTAVVVNLISLIYLIRKWIIFPEIQLETAEEIALVLANIPIVLLYFFILFL